MNAPPAHDDHLTGSSPRCRTAWILLALCAVALLLRLVNYDQSLWFDEACMSKQRLATLPQVLAALYGDIHPPLPFFFWYAWNRVFGDAEWAMRLFPLLTGLASVVLIFTAGKRLVGERAALGAAVMLCLSPVHLWYSIEARPYTAIVLGVLALVWLYDRLLDGEATRRTWWGYGILLYALLATHYYLAVYALLLAALTLVDRRARKRPKARRRILWLHGIGLLGIAAWVAAKVFLARFDSSMAYLRDFTPTELYRFLFQWCWTGNALPAGLEDGDWAARQIAWVAIQGLGVALFLAGLLKILRTLRERPKRGTLLLYLLAIPLFLLSLGWIGKGGNFVERSALPTLPFLFLIIALGWSSLPRQRWRIAVGALVLAALVANLAAYYRYHRDAWTVYKPHPDWRGLAGYFEEELATGAAGRPIFTAETMLRCLPYYDARLQYVDYVAPYDEGGEAMRAKLERRFGEGIGRWLGGHAFSVFEDYERHKARLREGTELWIHHSDDGTIETLQLDQRSRDGIFYLVKNRWLPPGDTSIETLVEHPRLELLEQQSFPSLTVWKMREAGL